MRPVSPGLLEDSLTAFVWITQNMLLGLSLWRLSRRLFPGDSLAGHLLHAALMFCSVITGVLIFVGSVRQFSAEAILAAAGITAVVLYVLTAESGTNGGASSVMPAGKSRISPGWVIAFCILIAHCVIDGLLTFPTDFDGLMYHLPMVDYWLQAGSLYDPEFGQWATPGGSELLAAWCCGPFSGDFLAPLNNLPVVVIWAAASLELCRLLGIEGGWAALATAASLTVYTLLHETDDASNDLLVVAAFMASAVYGIRYTLAPRRRLLLLAGASIGLLYGVKYFALGYAAVAWGTLVVSVLVAHGCRPALSAALGAAVVSLFLGGYWYVRNFVLTGLPLYPMGNPDELAYPDLWSTSLFGNRHPNLWPLFFEAIWRHGGPLHWTALALSPVVLCGVLRLTFVAHRLPHSPGAGLPWMSVGMLLIGSGMILWLTPYLVEDQPESLNHLKWAYTPLRYGLCFYSLTILCGMAVIQTHCHNLPRLISGLVFTGLVVVELWQITQRVIAHSREISFVPSVVLGLDLAILYFAVSWCSRRLSDSWRFGFLIMACILLAAGVGKLSERWHSGYALHFDRHFRTTAFSLLESDGFDEARICVLFNRPYPFFGSRREHHVINPRRYVSAVWLEEFAHKDGFRLIAAFASSEYKTYRFKGAAEYIDRNPDRISCLTGSSRLRVALIHPDNSPATSHSTSKPGATNAGSD